VQVLQVKTAEEVPRSELKVIAALKVAKRDSATALHSIAWQGIRLERQSDGEADLVIIDAQHGILVLEVKGGGIDVQDGAWYTTDRTGQRHQIKNPFEQAKASKHALIRYLKSTEPDIARKTSIVHAVVFPDVTCDLRWLGPDSPRAIVIDRVDLSDINEALTRIFAHWQVRCSISLEDQARLRAQLSPTVSIKRKLSDLVSETEDDLYRLTQEQIRVMDSLRRNRRLLVLGGAGTGKTVLAVERSRQLAKSGNSTLLLCFNRPLAAHLERWLEDSDVTVETFHSLCTKHFDHAGVP